MRQTAAMRAVEIDRFGGIEELHIVDDRSQPSPGEGEVLVRVRAAGVNPIDYKIRDGSSGVAKKLTEADFPLVLGREGYGEVAELGSGVRGLEVGQRVFGMAPMGHPGGWYAEYVVQPAEAVAPAPEGVAGEVLAGTALAGTTAWTAVHDLGHVQADDIVLVHGAGGGVGQFVVQLCLAAGATVYACASPRHRERIESWGAHHVDYTSQDFTQVTPRPTLIVDGVYFGTYEPSMAHLADGGRIVMLPTLADLAPAMERGIEISVPAIKPDPERLSELAQRVADGSLRVEVSQVVPLAQVGRAHEIVETGHAQGKVVLDVALNT